MSPGNSGSTRRAFVGLEDPPLTPADAPGIRITLLSDRALINAGDAILYRGFTAGRIESIDFDAGAGEARYSAFINAPFNDLLNSSTRFWDTSGISLNASTEGVQLNVSDLETLLSGGVAFETPPEMPAGEPVTPNTEFRLYASYDAILSNPYQYGRHYVVSFKQSLAGLVPGASVTFRGIQVGRVERILLKEFSAREVDGKGEPIPVLIYLEPGRLELPDTPASVERLQDAIEAAVGRGLRASLQTANLLTGRQRVEFDYYPKDPQQAIGEFDQYPMLPSVETGIARLEQQLNTLLTQLNALPLEDTVSGVNHTLGSINEAFAVFQTTAESLHRVLENTKTQTLPAELASALAELRSVLDGFSQDSEVYDNLNSTMASLRVTLEQVNQLTRELADRPSSVLIPVKRPPDPAPKARR
jgi:paraquat-inducible protein B